MRSHSKEKKKLIIHAIGYGHLDPVWLWDWREGCREMLATCRSALERMKETPEFRYSCSSAGVYQWVQQYAPDMFKEIRSAVRQGRWEIVGGWWMEPDLNLPSGESLIRQGLYGKRFFKQNFGIDCIIGFNPDSFGHPLTLPKILNQLGQIYYVFMRPEEHEKSLSNDVFIWEAADGSCVVASRISHGYGCDQSIDQKIDRVFEYLINHSLLKDGLCFYGVGDHGGGPTKACIQTLKELQIDAETHKINFSTLFEYFIALEPIKTSLPIVREELQHHARGCYSVHAEIKRLNRQCEQSLLSAEKWTAVAYHLLQRTVPVEALHHAWQNILFHQFHDVITGTSIRKGLEDTKMFLNESLAIAGRELFHAVRDIASQIPIEDEKGEFIVFNSLPWERLGPIEIEYAFPHEEKVIFVDDENRAVVHQDLQRAELTAAGRKHWVFIDHLPPMGYKTYRWAPSETSNTPSNSAVEFALDAGENWLENNAWRLEFDPVTGHLIKCTDKQHQIDILAGSAAIPIVFEDQSDTWSHDVARYDQQTGVFAEADVRLYEFNRVRAALMITSHYNHSTFRQKWLLYRQRQAIDLEISIDWHEQHKLLKYSFPLNLQHAKSFADQPYGHVERPGDGDEHPYQQWLTISGKASDTMNKQVDYNVSLLNNGNYSYSLHKSELRLTLLRSAIYAHHNPTTPDRNRIYDYSDLGRHDLTLSIINHIGPPLSARVVRRAHELNAPPFALIDYAHPGYLPKHAAFVEVKPDNIIATVLKKAEDGDSLVLRCYEVEGKETAVEIILNYNKLSGQFKIRPFQIKTLQLKVRQGALEIVESNGLEE